MLKKKALYLGFIALLAAVIFTFAACGGKDDDDPVVETPPPFSNYNPNHPDLKTNDNWASDSNNLQRFVLDFSKNLNPAVKAGKESTRLFFTLYYRDGNEIKTIKSEDWCDYSLIKNYNGAMQTGASVAESARNATTAPSATQRGPGWSYMASIIPTGSTGAVLPSGIRGLMLYGVSPAYYLTFEDFKYEKKTNKYVFTWTHNQNSNYLETHNLEGWEFKADGTFPGISKSVQTCMSLSASTLSAPWWNGATNDSMTTAWTLASEDPTWAEMIPTFPYNQFVPYPVLRGTETTGAPAGNTTDYLLAKASWVSPAGRYSKRNLNWENINTAWQNTTLTGAPANNNYTYVGKLKVNLDEVNKVLTVRGDLVLRAKTTSTP